APARRGRAGVRADRHHPRGAPDRRRLARAAAGRDRGGLARAHLQPAHRHRAPARACRGVRARAGAMRHALDLRQLRALLRAYLPLAPRTILLAKAASLMGFALLLGLALNLPAMFLGLRVTGMRATFPLVHLGAVVLLVAFTTATVVFTYGLVGRFVDRNRFG